MGNKHDIIFELLELTWFEFVADKVRFNKDLIIYWNRLKNVLIYSSTYFYELFTEDIIACWNIKTVFH